MYDAIHVSALPGGAAAYAGYIQGKWPTFAALERRFPGSRTHLLSIAVFASGDADCLDIENGDATIAQAPGWVKRQLAARPGRPCLYTSVSNVDALVTALTAAGLSRARVRLWSAHYGQGKHLCGPGTCGQTRHSCDGTQWTDSALGRSLDESVLLSSFFSLSAPGHHLITEESMLLKTGAGAITPVAIPEGATHLRLLAQDTATVGLHFHSHAPTTVDLSWAAGSHPVAVPSGILAALVRRVDAGTGDVSLVCELAARAGRRPGAPSARVRSDPVEQVQEAVGQCLVAAGVAAVDPAERGEHHAAGVEVEHGRQVVDVTRLV
jgi:hypothetical protein